MSDRLTWREMCPLYLAVSAQALIVFRWYLGSDAPAEIAPALRWISVIVAVLAGLALDLVVVTTTMGRREGRTSFWSWLTVGAAAIFSAAIALEWFGGPSAGPWTHTGYALIIFLFSQHLATARKVSAPAEQPAQNGHADEALPPRYTCKWCGAGVASAQAAGAAVTNGFCPVCKEERKIV